MTEKRPPVLPSLTRINMRLLSMSLTSSASTSPIRSPAPYAVMRMARCLRDVIAASNFSTSLPLSTVPSAFETLACRSNAVTSRRPAARSSQRIEAR